jgi:hypothetical protein
MKQAADPVLMEKGYFVQSLSETLSSGEIGLKHVPELLKRVLSEKMWQERVVPQTREVAKFATFQQFVEGTPPNGLGATVELLFQMVDNDPVAYALLAEATGRKAGNPTGNNQYSGINNNIINSTSKQGTGKAYGLRTLRKYAASSPAVAELQEAVLGGKLSVNAALVQAGLREKTITVPVDPERAAGTIARHFTQAQLAALISELVKRLDDDQLEWLDTTH